MADPVLTIEPDTIVKGNSYSWTKSFGDFLPATWTLRYAFVFASADGTTTTQFETTSTDNGDGTHLLALAVADTTAITSTGVHVWQLYAETVAGDSVHVGTGRTTVKPDFDAGAVDARTTAHKMVDLIEAALITAGGGGIVSYSNSAGDGSVSITRLTWDEAKNRLEYWRARLIREQRKEAVLAGRGHDGNIRGRFV